MNITITLLFLLSIAGFSGCAVSKTKLTERGLTVEILKTKSRAKRCNVVDKVTGENEIGSEELATNHTRNLAAESGGNAIVIDEVVPNGAHVIINATAYHCP